MGLFGKPKKPQALAAELESLSVLALANSPRSVETIFSSLSQYQYKTKFVLDIPSFIDALSEFDPDIILISLNLDHTDTMKVIAILQNLELPVIVFGEQDDEQTCLKLLNTELHHVIIPPLTFDSFMERVEFLAMERELSGNDSAPANTLGFTHKKTNWGKVIQLLNENLSETGQLHIFSESQLKGLQPVTDEELAVGKILDADIFITMPLNHKVILYLRSGSVLSQDSMERLHRYGTRVMRRR